MVTTAGQPVAVGNPAVVGGTTQAVQYVPVVPVAPVAPVRTFQENSTNVTVGPIIVVLFNGE